MNFNRADGDKIKIFDTDGVTPIKQSDDGCTLSALMSDGYMAIYFMLLRI